MAIINGPELDEMHDLLMQSVAELRRFIYEQISKDYPYGTVRLSTAEQLHRFRSMTEDDWIMLRQNLERQYQGMPDQHKRVQHDLDMYVGKMRRLEANRGEV